MRFINEEPDLYDKMQDSIKDSEMIPADEYYDLGEASKSGKIIIKKSKTFEAAMRYATDEAFADKRIAVLNFASASNPGGGVKNGSSAQEESLCRCSTLFPVLEQPRFLKDFYEPHRKARNPLHNDDIIYSPDIAIIKTDEDYPERMEPDDWCLVDVITCAAPNLRKNPSNRHNTGDGDRAVHISSDELYSLHLSRAQHILNAAAANDVDVLILGAFGCGAFENDPNVVARAYYDALKEYANYFDVIEFAVYTNAFETKNFKAFDEVFSM